MQARLGFERRAVVQPRGQEVDALEDQLAREADAVRVGFERFVRQPDEIEDRMRAEADPVVGRETVPSAILVGPLGGGYQGFLV